MAASTLGAVDTTSQVVIDSAGAGATVARAVPLTSVWVALLAASSGLVTLLNFGTKLLIAAGAP